MGAGSSSRPLVLSDEEEKHLLRLFDAAAGPSGTLNRNQFINAVKSSLETPVAEDQDGAENQLLHVPAEDTEIPSHTYSFDGVHAIVMNEILENKDVWIGETADMVKVANRFQQIDVPEMRVIHGEVIEKLGRIPRSSETNEEGTPYWTTHSAVVNSWKPHNGLASVKFSLLSHRWCAANSPDDFNNTKARAVACLSRYGRTVYQCDTYWWIDWTCADQDSTAGHIAALPLYIAACSEVLSLWSGPDCDGRGWISCERALSAAMNSPRAWVYLPPEVFAHSSGSKDSWWQIQDPALMAISVEGDRRYLVGLSKIAQMCWSIGFQKNWNSNGNVYADWGYTPDLTYGETKVYTWVMNHFSGM